MVIDSPKLFHGKVMHHRRLPRVNYFTYSVFYLALRLIHIADLNRGFLFGVDRPGLMSLKSKDPGRRDGSSFVNWISEIFAGFGVETESQNIILVTFPRVFGYVFNPISFWIAVDEDTDSIRAVLCQVNNTFGEHHCYLCLPATGNCISPDVWVETNKVFHVSPFIEREGSYRFRFALEDKSLEIWIDYYNAKGEKLILTSLRGSLVPASTRNLLWAFLSYPLMTFKVIALIHWQALKLVVKRIPYRIKPKKLEESLTVSKGIIPAE